MLGNFPDESADRKMKMLLKKVHPLDNQRIYDDELKLFLLLNDRMLISNLLKERGINENYHDEFQFLFENAFNFYDSYIYQAAKNFVATYEKVKK